MEEKVVKKENKKEYISTVGRRREAIARIRLYDNPKEDILPDRQIKKGQIFVNGIEIEKYFGGESSKFSYLEPYRVTNTLNKFATTIKVSGGGREGQLGAVILGIARALAKYDIERFRKILKKKRMLTRDPRTRERRKVGTGGKARRMKQSPKR